LVAVKFFLNTAPMKVSKIVVLAVAFLAIASVSTGCKKRPDKPITLFGKNREVPPDAGPTTNAPTAGNKTDLDAGRGRLIPEVPPVNNTNSNPLPTPEGGFPGAGWEDLGDYFANREMFAQNTVYFDFDRHEVKASERTKIDEVAVYLKGDAKVKILVEGHCDERGTEEYNRALGERRALSVREYLINSGIALDRVHTISFGEDKPAVPGQNEAAWTKNRRGVFVLLKPKK
jgi:peptidoglycan-associated lipoprotein